MNLNDMTLKGAKLAGANLDGVDLSGRDLTGTILKGVDLSGNDLTGTILKGADLTDAVLPNDYSLSGNNLTPITKINNDQTNQVIIAVNPEIPIAVLTTVFAATAPATPSKIIIKPAK